jgi:hypothetical protein
MSDFVITPLRARLRLAEETKEKTFDDFPTESKVKA